MDSWCCVNKSIKDKWGARLYYLRLNTLAGDHFSVVVKLWHLLFAIEGIQNMYYRMGPQLPLWSCEGTKLEQGEWM